MLPSFDGLKKKQRRIEAFVKRAEKRRALRKDIEVVVNVNAHNIIVVPNCPMTCETKAAIFPSDIKAAVQLMVFNQLYFTINREEIFYFDNKKFRIYASFGVLQTPNII
jgi:hypothetical protein